MGFFKVAGMKIPATSPFTVIPAAFGGSIRGKNQEIPVKDSQE